MSCQKVTFQKVIIHGAWLHKVNSSGVLILSSLHYIVQQHCVLWQHARTRKSNSPRQLPRQFSTKNLASSICYHLLPRTKIACSICYQNHSLYPQSRIGNCMHAMATTLTPILVGWGLGIYFAYGLNYCNSLHNTRHHWTTVEAVLWGLPLSSSSPP